MKHAVKVLGLMLMVAGFSATANAQFRQSVFLNLNVPTGGFASSINTNSVPLPLSLSNIGKEATIGFGGGYRVSYRFDVGVGQVAPFAQADLFWNSIDADLRDRYANGHGSAPKYFNIPVLIGVSYLYDELWNDITPYGEFGLGTDLFMITSETLKSTSGTEIRFSYKTSNAFAWMLGVGAYFGRHVSAGLYYYGLGKHYLDYTSKYENDQVAYEKLNGRANRTVGSFALKLGFHF